MTEGTKPTITGPRGEAMRHVEERMIAKWLISQNIEYNYETKTYVGELYHESIFLLKDSGLYLEYIPDMDVGHREVDLTAKRKSLRKHSIPYMFLGKKDLRKMGDKIRRYIELAPEIISGRMDGPWGKLRFYRALRRFSYL